MLSALPIPFSSSQKPYQVQTTSNVHFTNEETEGQSLSNLPNQLATIRTRIRVELFHSKACELKHFAVQPRRSYLFWFLLVNSGPMGTNKKAIYQSGDQIVHVESR